MRDTLDCSPEPSSVRAARLFVVDKLQEWRCDDLVDSAALVTSELATNAVVHTGMPYSVHVERQADGVRVEVVDLRHDLPLRPDATPAQGDAGGDLFDSPSDPNVLFSGLGMVDAVATRWGSEPRPGNGKVVWFELVTSRSGESRSRVEDLRDLRDADDDAWQAWARGPVGALTHDAADARHLARDDDLTDHVWRHQRHLGRWLLLGTVLVVVVAGGLVLLSR